MLNRPVMLSTYVWKLRMKYSPLRWRYRSYFCQVATLMDCYLVLDALFRFNHVAANFMAKFGVYCTGQSLTSFVTVTNKLGDETIVVLGGWLRVSIDKRNHESFWLYWLTVSMLKRNHIENEVVMVATESQTNFAWSIAISMGLIRNDESYLW